MKKYQIYGIGAALVDTEVVVTDEFLNTNKIDKSLMTLVDEDRQFYLLGALKSHSHYIKRSCGGSACNSIVAASSFGLNAFYSAKVADDEDGQFFVEDLQSTGVDFHNAEVSAGVTGKCLVMVTDDAERTMNTFLGANLDLTSNEVDETALINSDWLYLEGYLVTDDSRTAVAVKAMECAKANQVKTSLSLSDPFVVQVFEDNLHKVIGDGVDLLFCNSEEARSFTNTNSTEAAAKQLKKYAKTFVITRGAGGSLSYDGTDLVKTAGVTTNAVDTNGAGDMYAGAFLYAINAGHDYAWAAKFANAASARVVSQFGPRIEAIEYEQIKQQFLINDAIFS
ncbi:adenosine kinase [Candidatus Njordibacter sp. Uisw_039]|uniref:adenosine kinase n=1 Tax=Candidatus Njordibacter sp. Uisw_039 TaxID=3230972 RepID=UPI003D3CC167